MALSTASAVPVASKYCWSSLATARVCAQAIERSAAGWSKIRDRCRRWREQASLMRGGQKTAAKILQAARRRQATVDNHVVRQVVVLAAQTVRKPGPHARTPTMPNLYAKSNWHSCALKTGWSYCALTAKRSACRAICGKSELIHRPLSP